MNVMKARTALYKVVYTVVYIQHFIRYSSIYIQCHYVYTKEVFRINYLRFDKN